MGSGSTDQRVTVVMGSGSTGQRVKAVTKNLFIFSHLFRPFPFFPFPFPSFTFPFFLPPQRDLSDPTEGFGSTVSFPSERRATFSSTRHVPWALNIPKYIRPRTHFWCIRSPEYVSGGCKLRPVSVKRNLNIGALCCCFWMYGVLLRSRLLKSAWLFFTFYFVWWLKTSSSYVIAMGHQKWLFISSDSSTLKSHLFV